MTVRWLAAVALTCAFACAPRPTTRVELRSDHVEPELITVVHVVKPGETLYRISRTYGLSADELMAANGISDPTALKVGQELLIPDATEVRKVPAPDEPLPPVEKSPSVEPPPKVRPESNDAVAVRGDTESRKPPAEVKIPTSTSPKSAGDTQASDAKKGTLEWPLRGVLYGRYGKKGKEPHDGIDLAAPAGTPVKTAAEGQVLYAGEQKGYGMIVIVEHSPLLVTLYAHNRDLRVKTGQKVRSGQVIATVGESGRTSGPHLHFEVRRDGVPVDPLSYLGPVPAK